MAIHVVRYTLTDMKARWAVCFGAGIAPLQGRYPTTGAFLTDGGVDEAKAARPDDVLLSLSDVRLLSPVTETQQVILQGLNYASHAEESGVAPENVTFNTIFTKAPSSLCGARDDIVRPPHVRLLDYEIELGLVVGRTPPPGVTVSPETLADYLAGLVIVNDISARDVQLPQGQFYKGKSYRTFGPTGPFLVLPTRDEWRSLSRLRMQLKVNGTIRQDALCGDMLFPPHQTLTELARLQDLHPGDLIATGTPGGCAARAPGKLGLLVFRHVLTETQRWRLFQRLQTKNPLFLQPGDQIQASIRTSDGALDLGEQCNVVAC